MQRDVTGSKYDRNLDVAEIAKLVRQDIKEAVKKGELPKAKYSVRIARFAGGRSLDVRIADPAISALYNPAGWKIGPYGVESAAAFADGYTPEAKGVADKVRGIVNAYNFDNSDPMTDYFHVNFYEHVEWDHAYEARERAKVATALLEVA